LQTADLSDNEFRLRQVEMPDELRSGVSRIGAINNTASCNDSKPKDRVFDLSRRSATDTLFETDRFYKVTPDVQWKNCDKNCEDNVRVPDLHCCRNAGTRNRHLSNHAV
jgi:hypothetical protein